MNASPPVPMPRAPAMQRLTVLRSRHGAGFCAESLRDAVPLTDPYVAVDHFRISQAAFGAHPHAGFSAVTYLFEDSPGALVSRDSLGGAWPVEPGGLHWTLAGSGLVHEEFPARPGLAAHGLQMIINLPAAQKRRAPAVLRLAGGRMPQRHGAGWREVQVFGGASPLALPVLAALRIVHADAGADCLVESADPGFAWMISGRGRLAGQAVAAGQAWPLGAADPLHAETALVLAVFSGRPLREPVVQHGPFVMNTEAEIVGAMQRFQCGQMGRLQDRAPTVTAEPTQEP